MQGQSPGKAVPALETAGAVALFILMVVVFVDVVGRNLFNRPLPWGTELLEVVLAVLIFALYPVLALRSSHITVDLVPIPRRLQLPQRALAGLVGAVLFGVIAFCTARQAIRSAGYGDASALLQIPTAWVLWGMCALSVLTALGFLVAIVKPPAQGTVVHGTLLD
ncbi:TRAP transporter small permease [Caenimonas sp. SL110]|uniref:TRAP transporter small permease n=1 Tax=Caenimonas sp. SL110 TaxID=1450524 RepID=UPI00069EBE3E|nr:TRAP transporter small permease [Caenimonas sp. SL110]